LQISWDFKVFKATKGHNYKLAFQVLSLNFGFFVLLFRALKAKNCSFNELFLSVFLDEILF
jgi:hypothetical protein